MSMSQDVDIMLSAGGVSSKFEGNLTILQRTWTHLCWIHTPGQDVIYSNGKVLEPPRLAGEDQETFVKNADVFDSALILGQTPSKVREDFSIRKMFQGFLTELNIWSKELTKDEIQKMTKCKDFAQGNIVQWKENAYKIEGERTNIYVENIKNITKLCNRKIFFVIPYDRDLRFSHKQCRSLGGQIAAPKTEEENQDLLKAVKSFPVCLDNPNSISWIGIEKLKNTNTWKMVMSTRNASNFTMLTSHKLSKSEGSTLEDYCVTLTASGDWNMYRDCYSATNSILACNVCEFENTPSFSLKGSCPNSGPNWNYYLTRDPSVPLTYYFEGYKRDKVAPGPGGGWHLYHAAGAKYELYLTLQSFTDGELAIILIKLELLVPLVPLVLCLTLLISVS